MNAAPKPTYRHDDWYRASLLRRVKESAAGCWEWQGTKGSLGYAQTYYHGRRWMAHRLAYALFVGPIPQGRQVCHRCDNPACCRPDHLWLGSNLDNQIDSIKKGRHANAEKTHCAQGHDYALHAYIRPDGRRACRICARERYHRPPKAPSNAVKTHCLRGHPLSGENLYVTPGDGRRQCRICRLESTKKRYRARLQETESE